MKNLFGFLFLAVFLSAVETHLCQQIIRIPEDFTTIQAGISAAVNGDTILVADNTYYENISFKGKAITLASYFLLNGDTAHINNTIIDGSQSTIPDSGSVVSFISGEDTNSILCGFTIRGGSGTLAYGRRVGGGILCYSSGAKIFYNHIINNGASWSGDYAMGGGICAVGPGYVIIKYNKIMNNIALSNFSWGGGILALRMSGCISNNIIDFNIAEGINGFANGGGIMCESDSIPTEFILIDNNSISFNKAKSNSSNQVAINGGVDIIITKTVFSGNNVTNNSAISNYAAYSGGMRISGSTNESFITGNTFYNNIASSPGNSYGGGLWIFNSNKKLLIEGNNFIANSAKYGGGLYIYNSESTLLRNSISWNVASQMGGGISILNSSNLIQNNLIKSNLASYGGGIRINSTGDSNEDIIDPGFCAIGNPIQYNIKELVSQPVLINNTIIQNEAQTVAGAIYSQSSQSEILNSVFWGNSSPNPPQNQIFISQGYINIEYSNIEGGYSGTGNINNNPSFSEDSLCCLNPGSPCIDAGKPDTLFDAEDPYNPGYALYPAMGNLRNDMGWHGGMGSGSVVPVELIDFTAGSSGSDVFLSWSTATEMNNHGFEVERRTLEERFHTIGFVSGKGTSTKQHDYTFTDRNISGGIYWYRLKQMDYNGSFQYSDEVEVVTTGLLAFLLKQNFPNPFNPSTKISYTLKDKGNVKLLIYDIKGELISTVVNEKQQQGSYEVDFTLPENISTGVYFYRILVTDYDSRSVFSDVKKMIYLK